MASNFHSDLPNDQLHNPKDYVNANNSSVLTKSDAGQLEWNTSPYRTETVMTCSGDISGGLHHKSFYICWDDRNKLHAYFDVSGAGGTFTPTTGFSAMRIGINANNTNLQVAAAILQELGRLPSPYAFTTSVDNKGKVSFGGMTNSEDTLDYDTNFEIENTKTYTGTTVLTSTQGVLEWLPGGGGSGGGAVNDVSAGSPGTSSGAPLTISPTTGNVVVKSNAFAGTTNVGHVPSSQNADQSKDFLRADGTWAAPSGSGQAAIQVTNGSGIDATNFNNNNILQVDNTVIRTTGPQTKNGIMTFDSDVILSNPPSNTETGNKVVTAGWVNGKQYGQGTVTKITADSSTGLTGGDITSSGTIGINNSMIVDTYSQQFINGIKVFNGAVEFTTIPESIDPPTGDKTQKIPTCNWVNKELQAVGGGVTDVTATLPLNSTGGQTPDISMKRASRSDDGYLHKTDYSRFNAKQDPISLTTNGTGAATLTGTVLNIPTVSGQTTPRGFEQSFKGFINIAKAGNFMQDISSSTPFGHTVDITGKAGLTSMTILGGCFHMAATTEDFRYITGVVEGIGTIIFELHEMGVDCSTGTPTIQKVADSGPLVLAGKPTCWEIRTTKKVQFNPGTVLALSINLTSATDNVRASYAAQYQALY